MKNLTALIVFLACSLVCRANEDPNYLYSVNFSNGFAASRYAKPEYVEKIRTNRSKCVLVNWAYSPKDENNLDDLKSERERASQAINKELGNRTERVVAAATIGGVTSFWVVYTETGDDLGKALDGRLRELTQSKYRIRTVSDAEWSLYKKSVQQFKEQK